MTGQLPVTGMVIWPGQENFWCSSGSPDPHYQYRVIWEKIRSVTSVNWGVEFHLTNPPFRACYEPWFTLRTLIFWNHGGNQSQFHTLFQEMPVYKDLQPYEPLKRRCKNDNGRFQRRLMKGGVSAGGNQEFQCNPGEKSHLEFKIYNLSFFLSGTSGWVKKTQMI